MIIGVPTEVKQAERRVGLVPANVAELTARGHEVWVQHDAGVGSGFDNDSYLRAGARIAESADDVFAKAEMIVKVKEPQAQERARLGPQHTLFTYLHLAPDPQQTKDLLASGCTAIAYETVTDDQHRLPLLAPMSAVAGRLAVQAAAHYLESPNGGAGMLMGGVPGVVPANVTVIGGGVVGTNSIEMALGLGADVTVLDRNPDVLTELAARFGPALRTVYSNSDSLTEWVVRADVVIGAVLVAGAEAPKLVTRQHVAAMGKGSVLVDVAIDQGGCFETSHATTHKDPVYEVDGTVHYCVANMPGAVPRTSTLALNNATLPFVLALASGPTQAMLANPHLLAGLNIHNGQVTDAAVAEALDHDYVEPTSALG